MNIYKMILKNGDSRTIHSKRWILLTIKNFKESIMMNNNKAKKVWKYYFHLKKSWQTDMKITLTNIIF
jgi:hypothetical protein